MTESADALLRTARGRVLALVYLASAAQCLLLARLGQDGFPIHRYPAIVTAVTTVGVLGSVWTWWRRDRIGQSDLVALLVLWIAEFAVFIGAVLPPGSAVGGEWAGLCPIILAAVFVDRRSVAAGLGALSVAVMTGIVVNRTAGEDTVMVVSITLWVAAVVAVVVRVLREVAVNALARANRGEVTDPLTGLANRRGLERHAPDLWRRRAEADEPVALIVLDIDHFKQINDTRGHAAGDEVIRAVADVLAGSLRQNDVAVRLGGEEFLVLVSTPAGTAVQIGERLRQAVERTVSGVTVSVGVLEAQPDPHDEPTSALWTAVDVADQAMYEAKRSGRNRVVAAAGTK